MATRSSVVFVPEPPAELAQLGGLDPYGYGPIEDELRYAVFELAIRGCPIRSIRLSPDLFLSMWRRTGLDVIEVERSGSQRFAVQLPTPAGIVRVICDASL